ncbi:hypothetical protein J6590_059114 [Homalodisca vitripennis]|nr:hypothetical protein J6590_059114 [Homalodisca vitripennis]
MNKLVNRTRYRYYSLVAILVALNARKQLCSHIKLFATICETRDAKCYSARDLRPRKRATLRFEQIQNCAAPVTRMTYSSCQEVITSVGVRGEVILVVKTASSLTMIEKPLMLETSAEVNILRLQQPFSKQALMFPGEITEALRLFFSPL